MQIHDILKQYFPEEKIKKGEDIAKYLTLKTGVKVDFLVVFNSFADWQNLSQILRNHKLEIGLVGGGSNLVISRAKKDFYILNRWIKKSIIRSDKKYTFIKVSSGYPIFRLVRETVNQGLAGLQYHWGLPGTVGGALYMNSKWTRPLSYVGDVVHKVLLLDKKGRFRWEDREYMRFDYDYSILQDTGEFLVEVVFRLENSDYDTVYKQALQAYEYRRETQPFGRRTSGCFFQNISEEEQKKHNLPTRSAGWLIDQAGLKGMQIGGFRVSETHANFIENTDQGNVEDLRKLIDLIQKKVKEKFDIDLKLEVVIE